MPGTGNGEDGVAVIRQRVAGRGRLAEIRGSRRVCAKRRMAKAVTAGRLGREVQAAGSGHREARHHRR